MYFDPEHPESSVLKPGTSLELIWTIMTGTLTFVMGIALFWLKTIFRKLLSSFFIITMGSGLLMTSGEKTYQAVMNQKNPPIVSGAFSILGATLTTHGIRRFFRTLKSYQWNL